MSKYEFLLLEVQDAWFSRTEPILCYYCGKRSECEISIKEKDGEKECCNACDRKFQEKGTGDE